MKDLNTMINAEILSAVANRSVGEKLMDRFGSLRELGQASIDELTQIKGIGNSTAHSIQCAFSLASRLSNETLSESPCLDKP